MRHSDGLGKLERAALHAIGAFGVLVLSGTFIFVILRPATKQRSVDTLTLNQLENVIANGPKTLGHYKELGETKVALFESIRNYRKRLPEAADLNGLLGELSLLAKQHSVTVLSVQPAQQVVGEIAAFQRVRFRLLGSYRATCNVIAGLGELESLVWLTGADMGMDESMKRLQPVDLDLVLLFAPPSTTVGKMKISPDIEGTEA